MTGGRDHPARPTRVTTKSGVASTCSKSKRTLAQNSEPDPEQRGPRARRRCRGPTPAGTGPAAGPRRQRPCGSASTTGATPSWGPVVSAAAGTRPSRASAARGASTCCSNCRGRHGAVAAGCTNVSSPWLSISTAPRAARSRSVAGRTSRVTSKSLASMLATAGGSGRSSIVSGPRSGSSGGWRRIRMHRRRHQPRRRRGSGQTQQRGDGLLQASASDRAGRRRTPRGARR